MDRESTERALHQRVLDAIARGARAQDQAEIVHAHHQAVHEELRETIAAIRRRGMRALRPPPRSGGA